MKSPGDDFMVHFRWITPLVLSILTAMAGFILKEIHETKLAAIEYTNLMVQQSNAQIKWVQNDVQDLKVKVDRVSTDVTSIRTLLTKKLVGE